EALALADIGNGGGARHGIRPQFGSKRLHRGERNHFATYLCEAFGAAFDGYISVRVDRNDVPGVMPTVEGALEYAGIFRAHVPEHDVWAAHVKAPAFLDARHWLKPRFYAGQEPPDRAKPIEHRGVKREHRCGLGDAVTLQDAQAKFFHVGAA